MDGEEGVEDTILHDAVRYTDINDVKHALRTGYNPNQIGLYQWTPLHEAANNGDLSIIDLLLQYNGDPNKRDWLKGSTAMHYAASQGHALVLQRLLDNGGDYDIANAEGKTALDVATGACVSLLKKQRNANSVRCSSELKEQDQFEADVKTLIEENNNNNDSDDRKVSQLDLDGISVTSDGSTSSWPSSRAWETGSNSSLNKKIVLGHVQLSFEYNSKTNSLKIRVWQISDLIFPPAEKSMISSIYVRSYLMPDKKRDTKRKTDEVQVYPKTKSNEEIEVPHKQFEPRSFPFTKALEYKKITKDIVSDRLVYLEVCVVQKYTRRSFVIATWNSPLSLTVKRLLKEKYPLTPRLSTELPSNMKIYGANLTFASYHNSAYSSSVPNSCTHSMTSLSRMAAERAYSDSDLQEVAIGRVKHVPSVEITVPSDSDSEGKNSLKEIVGLNRYTDEVTTKITIDKVVEDAPEMIDLMDLEDVTIDTSCNGNMEGTSHDVLIHVPGDRNSEHDYTTQKKSSVKKSKKFSLRRRSSKRADEIIRNDTIEKEDSATQTDRVDNSAESLTMIPIEFELQELSENLSRDPESAQLPIEIIPKIHKNPKELIVGKLDYHISENEKRIVKGKGIGKSSSSASSNRKGRSKIHNV